MLGEHGASWPGNGSRLRAGSRAEGEDDKGWSGDPFLVVPSTQGSHKTLRSSNMTQSIDLTKSDVSGNSPKNQRSQKPVAFQILAGRPLELWQDTTS